MSIGIVYDALKRPESLSSCRHLRDTRNIFISDVISTCIASRLVTFETAAAIGAPKSLDIDHRARAIATVSPYGKEKWRKDADE